MASVVEKAKRLVVKVGSSLVTNNGQGLDRDALARWAREIATLRHEGRLTTLSVEQRLLVEGVTTEEYGFRSSMTMARRPR